MTTFSLSLPSKTHLALFCVPLNFNVCISKFLFRCSVLILFVFQCFFFFSISINIDGFCKIMKFVSDGFCKIIDFVYDEMCEDFL